MRSDADRIVEDLANGDFKLTQHARARMAERSVSYEDIRRCGLTAKKAVAQGNGKFLISGKDLDGDVLKVIAAYDGESVVITVIGD